jgi:membrane protein implicated in regulation of membrane protease activity
MTTIYLACAIIGGSVLVFQFVMTVLGLGDDGMDIADDVPDLDLDLNSGNLDAADPHGSSSVFGVLSFKTVVAALTFFGIAGMAARTSGLPAVAQFAIAIACGFGAMYGVYYLMKSIYRLGQSGNLRITNTVGRTATVYIPIPGDNSGQGKVQVKVQDRLAEFIAVTSAEDKLTTGAKVVVVGVLSGNTLEVEPLTEPAEANA